MKNLVILYLALNLSHLKFQLGELEEELKKYKIQNEELTSQCVEYKTSIDNKVGEALDWFLFKVSSSELSCIRIFIIIIPLRRKTN